MKSPNKKKKKEKKEKKKKEKESEGNEFYEKSLRVAVNLLPRRLTTLNKYITRFNKRLQR